MGPGRPKKNQTLTTLTTEVPEVNGNVSIQYTDIIKEDEPLAFTAEPVEVPKELKSLALSIVRHPVSQHWMLIQFKFDFASKTIGALTVVETHTDRIEIVERFKMMAGAELMSAV